MSDTALDLKSKIEALEARVRLLEDAVLRAEAREAARRAAIESLDRALPRTQAPE